MSSLERGRVVEISPVLSNMRNSRRVLFTYSRTEKNRLLSSDTVNLCLVKDLVCNAAQVKANNKRENDVSSSPRPETIKQGLMISGLGLVAELSRSGNGQAVGLFGFRNGRIVDLDEPRQG